MDETSAVFHELLDEMRSLERTMLDHPQALTDEQSRCETYKWIFSITQVAFDCFVWGDVVRPRFVEIVGPDKKWGGDNADAFYRFIPVDPARTYRVTGERGDAVYLSLTVYGGPDDGHYSERIVGSANDDTITFDADGRFELYLSPVPPPVEGATWIELEPDAVAGITRDYLADPSTGRRTSWEIECIDDPTQPPPEWRETDADLARRMRCALTWVRDQAAIAPIGIGEPNHVDPPYPVPTVTFGWAAGDASYALGGYQLADGEALVLRGRSPECVFWNLCLWNPLLHTYNYAYDRVTINGMQVAYEDDGSWVIVIAAGDPGHPNWVSTQGHQAGRIWFRWFLPEHTPDEISAEVVPLDAVLTSAPAPAPSAAGTAS
jgi:hypothetical protein